MYKVKMRNAISDIQKIECEDKRRQRFESLAAAVNGVIMARAALDYEHEQNHWFNVLSQRDQQDVARAYEILCKIEARRNEVLQQLPNASALFPYGEIG